MTPINRRDFLRLRVAQGQRVLDLSCQSLYMRLLETSAGATAADSGDEFDPIRGEPPTIVRATTREELAQQLDAQMHNVDAVRLNESGWLESDDLRTFLAPLLAAFRERGGRIEES